MTREMILTELKRSLDGWAPETTGDEENEFGAPVSLCCTTELAEYLIDDLERAGLKLVRA